MSRKITRIHRLVGVVVAVLAVTAAIAAPRTIDRTSLEAQRPRPGGPPPPNHEISLDVSGFKRDIINLLSLSGGTLAVELSANADLGIGTSERPPEFPGLGDTGWIVFEEPDGCYSWVRGSTCPVDETFLEFTPDYDLPGRSDFDGNVDRLVGLTDFGGGGQPTIFLYDSNTGQNDAPTPVGAVAGPGADEVVSRCSSRWTYAGSPCTTDADCPSGETCRLVPVSPDGYGYGADDDLPGLVILSDTGVGLVLDENFNFPPGPLRARNLAGFLNDVTYQLNDKTSRTSVLAHMVVPGNLFDPLVLHDNCVGSAESCVGTKSRIDGGPVLDDVDIDALVEDKVITLRIFVVNGTAPSILEDANGDGVVAAEDAEIAGYPLISGEEVLAFRIYRDPTFPVFGNYDFDGNGILPPVLPATLGGLSRVPR